MAGDLRVKSIVNVAVAVVVRVVSDRDDKTSNTSGVITHSDKNVENPIWDLLYFGMHRYNFPTELERNEVPGHDEAPGWLRLTAGSHISIMKKEKYSLKVRVLVQSKCCDWTIRTSCDLLYCSKGVGSVQLQTRCFFRVTSGNDALAYVAKSIDARYFNSLFL